eukprot:2089816-Rhodomonas_salina.2
MERCCSASCPISQPHWPFSLRYTETSPATYRPTEMVRGAVLATRLAAPRLSAPRLSGLCAAARRRLTLSLEQSSMGERSALSSSEQSDTSFIR